MTRSRFAAIVVAALVAASFQSHGSAQGARAIVGDWTLNRGSSEFPREIGFTPEWMRPAVDTGSGGGGRAGGGRGGGRRGGGGGGSGGGSGRAPAIVPESADDAKRAQLLTDEVRNPPARVAIAESGGAITITNDQGEARTFHPGTREDLLHFGDLPVSATATWVDDQLVVVYNVEQGHQLRYTYSASAAPRRLRVDVQFVERGGGDSVVRMYDPAAPSDPRPTATRTAPAGSVPAAPQPVDVQPPGSELKGLTRVGVVVEDLDPKAAECGLTRSAIESAATKALTNAGLKVALNSDEDTYVYVNVMTTTMASGFCVSRYDVSLFTHTTATLSYQTKPALAQVSLLHKGGLSGGGASTHSASVIQGVTQYAEQFAAQIRSANK